MMHCSYVQYHTGQIILQKLGTSDVVLRGKQEIRIFLFSFEYLFHNSAQDWVHSVFLFFLLKHAVYF